MLAALTRKSALPSRPWRCPGRPCRDGNRQNSVILHQDGLTGAGSKEWALNSSPKPQDEPGEASPSWKGLGDTHRFPWRTWGTPGAVGSGVTLEKKSRKGQFGMGRWRHGEPGCPSRNGDTPGCHSHPSGSSLIIPGALKGKKKPPGGEDFSVFLPWVPALRSPQEVQPGLEAP